MKLYFKPILLTGGMEGGGDYPATGESNEGGDEGGYTPNRSLSPLEIQDEFTGMSPMTEIELPIAEESVKSEAAAIAPAEQAPAIEITPIELG